MLLRLTVFGLINLLSSALSGAAGGGGSLIGVPVLVLLGLSPSQAIATSKFNGLGTAAGSSLRFFREKLTDRRIVILFSLVGAIGSVLGSLLLLHLSKHERLLQDITALAILVVGIPVLYARNMGLAVKVRSLPLKAVGLLLLLVGVLFQSALGAGLGSLQLVVLIGCFGMTALTASATRRVMQLTVAIISLGIFISVGLVDYRYGIIAFITSTIGGFMGAHIAIKKGNKFVVNLFAITSALLALQLLWR